MILILLSTRRHGDIFREIKIIIKITYQNFAKTLLIYGIYINNEFNQLLDQIYWILQYNKITD